MEREGGRGGREREGKVHGTTRPAEAHWVLDEADDGSVQLLASGKDDTALDHEVCCRDDNGKDGSQVVRVGEVAEPERERDERPIELREELQQHVVLALCVCVRACVCVCVCMCVCVRACINRQYQFQ